MVGPAPLVPDVETEAVLERLVSSADAKQNHLHGESGEELVRLGVLEEYAPLVRDGDGEDDGHRVGGEGLFVENVHLSVGLRFADRGIDCGRTQVEDAAK